MTSTLKRGTIAVAAAAAAVAVAAVGSGSATAATGCQGQIYEQPFTRWLDYANYVTVPNGSFESSAGWTLTGDAADGSGNEPFYVGSDADSESPPF